MKKLREVEEDELAQGIYDAGYLSFEGLWSWLLFMFGPAFTSNKVLCTVIPITLFTVAIRIGIQVGTQGSFSQDGSGKGFQGVFSPESVSPFTTASMLLVCALCLSPPTPHNPPHPAPSTSAHTCTGARTTHCLFCAA